MNINSNSNTNNISKIDLLDNQIKSNELFELTTKKKEDVIKTSSIKDINLDDKDLSKFEYSLSNSTFGYNDNSKDFFIKVIKNGAISQYPTEEMMKLKEYLISLNKKN